jgi:hydrophobic/amphiphilic exporter-1 (mainly G- bacteria), HAE1 family
VIGGTITSTILTLLVIPTFYEIIDDLREGGKRLVRRIRGLDGERRTANSEQRLEASASSTGA